MQALPEDWSADLPPLLTTRWLGRSFWHLPQCASTNDEAATRANQGCAEGTLVAAEQQTSGRGRLGRTWHSPAGANLYFSFVLRPTLGPAALPPMTLLVGAAVAETLHHMNIECRLKWPNDVMLPTAAGMRKAGGILTEMATASGSIKHVVVGIGLNVLLTGFPPELADRATSLQLAGESAPSRLALLAAFLNTFEPLYEQFLSQGTDFALACWRRYGWLGQACSVERESGSVTGRAVDVDPSGALVVQDAAGKRHVILSGEVVTKL